MSNKIPIFAALLATTLALPALAQSGTCWPVTAYQARVQQAFGAYREARYALLDDIKAAKYMTSAPNSKGYAAWNTADARAAEAEVHFQSLTRLQTYQGALACHSAAKAHELQPYLYALTNMEIADNLLFQARGDLLEKCNSAVTAYMPYLRAADQAVDMAKKDVSGKIKAHFASDYIAQMPDSFANMREIRGMCHE